MEGWIAVFGEDGCWSPLCSTCGLLCRLNETAARARARHACSSPADLSLFLSLGPGQAARGWRQLVIAAEHRRRGLPAAGSRPAGGST